jgi:hypothetical protein
MPVEQRANQEEMRKHRQQFKIIKPKSVSSVQHMSKALPLVLPRPGAIADMA